MKHLKTTFLKIAVFFFLATTTTSCIIDGFSKITGNRNVLTKSRKVSEDFNSIAVSRGLDVYITQGNKNAITVEADENLHDVITTEVRNGVLSISAEENIGRAKAKKVYVTTHGLEKLTASSGSSVRTENTLTATSFTAKASSGASLRLHIKADSLWAKSSSGASLKMMGEAADLTVKASSGSDIRAYDLIAAHGTAKASSGASINLHVTESIDAKASSGGDIDYKGNPKTTHKKKSSGGSISAY